MKMSFIKKEKEVYTLLKFLYRTSLLCLCSVNFSILPLPQFYDNMLTIRAISSVVRAEDS